MVNVVNLSQELLKAQSQGYAQASMFNMKTLYAIYFVAMACIIVAVIFWYFWNDSKKTRFLRFVTEDEAQIIKGNIDDQKFIKKNRAWHINKTKPILLRTFFGLRPMFLISDNIAIPWQFKKLIRRKRDIVLSAESLKTFCDHDNIKTVMRMTQSSKQNNYLMLGLGAMAGILLGIIVSGFL